ncbi:MAG: hypothetical protein ACO37W_09040, partial [Prochlorotrichaceae cyanobacterium]
YAQQILAKGRDLPTAPAPKAQYPRTILAIQNAASIAGMVLTTECIVVDKPEPKDKAPAGGMGGDFDY